MHNLKMFPGTEEKNKDDRREMWHVSGKLNGAEDKKWNREEYRKHQRVKPRYDAENKYEAEQRFDRAGREHKEIIRISGKTEHVHKIPIMLTQEIDAEFWS